MIFSERVPKKEILEVSPQVLIHLKGIVGELVGRNYVLKSFGKGEYPIIFGRAREAYHPLKDTCVLRPMNLASEESDEVAGKDDLFAFSQTTFEELKTLHTGLYWFGRGEGGKKIGFRWWLLDAILVARCEKSKKLLNFKRIGKKRTEEGKELGISSWLLDSSYEDRMDILDWLGNLELVGWVEMMMPLAASYRKFSNLLRAYRTKKGRKRKPDQVVFQENGEVHIFEFKTGDRGMREEQRGFYENLGRENLFNAHLIRITGIPRRYYVKSSAIQD